MRRLNLLVVLLSVFLISGCVGQDTAPDVESSAVDCFGSFTPGEILPLEVGLSELNSDLTISKEDYVEDGISVVRNIAGFYGPKEVEGAKPYLFSINAMELKEGSDFDGYSSKLGEICVSPENVEYKGLTLSLCEPQGADGPAVLEIPSLKTAILILGSDVINYQAVPATDLEEFSKGYIDAVCE